jgi:hypothetical protein
MTTYSFLDKKFNPILNVRSDVEYSRELGGNTLTFNIQESILIVEEYENNYEDEDLVATKKIALNKGDHLICCEGITALTLISLIKLGVKVSLLDSRLDLLPPERQTEDIKAEIVYFLVSLD